MQNINETILKNFNDNISYIQLAHPKLFQKLSALDSAIEQNKYLEKYELIYENNGFDVFENTTNTYLYNKNSSKHTSLAKDSIDYNKDEDVFEGFHKHIISDEDLSNYEKEAPFEHQMSGFAPIIHYTQQHSQKNNNLKSIHKFIFFGVGLGLHIKSIHQKILSKVYFIIEDDLELFRLSLFTTNYKNIADTSTLIFSIFEDNEEFSRSSTAFLEAQYYYNHYIKYFHLLSHSQDKRNQFHIAITSQPHSLFFYTSLLTQYMQPLTPLNEAYKFLSNTFNVSDEKMFSKPFLLIAAGPSLQKNMQWLKKNHKNFITVALSATLSALEKENISPDIITHADPFDAATIHFDKINSYELFKNSLCIFSSKIPLNILKKFSKENIYLFEVGTNYKKESLKLSASCIGSITYQLLLKIKAKNIYLLGLNLSVDSLSGKTHSDSHQYAKTLGTKENAFDTSIMSYKESLFKIKGNLSPTVLTTPHFHTSIDSINNSTSVFKQETTDVYNLNDGASFDNTTALNPHKVSFIDANSLIKVHQNLLTTAKEHSSISLNDAELSVVNKKLTHAKKMLKKILKLKKLKKISSELYLLNLQELSQELTNNSELMEYDLSRVIDTYFKYILSYIFDFFNLEDNKENFTYVNDLNSMLLNHLCDIINYYIFILSKRG